MREECGLNATRRRFVAGSAGAAMFGLPHAQQRSSSAAKRSLLGEAAPGQNEGGNASSPPLGPFPEDAKKVLLFFAFSCPFSAMSHESFIEWAGTLPKPIEFARFPTVMNDSDQDSIVAHSMVRVLAPTKLLDFERAVFASIARGGNYAAAKTYVSALRESVGAKLPTISAAQHEQIAARVLRAGRLTNRYALAVTPSLAIGGSLVLTPNQTGGDYQSMIALANGSISRILETH